LPLIRKPLSTIHHWSLSLIFRFPTSGHFFQSFSWSYKTKYSSTGLF